MKILNDQERNKDFAMKHPYSDLPARALWRPAVAERSMFDIEQMWQPKFAITERHKILTFGSCFAQHIGRALRAEKFDWFVPEQPPMGLSTENKERFNYDVFSCRTGNIYTTTLLLQWTRWALGKQEMPEECWTEGSRYLDPFRPRIEPDGFASREELLDCRRHTLDCFREGIRQAHIFVFTLGLTESWHDVASGCEYPLCPGTAGGTFDPERHRFHNQEFSDVRRALSDAMQLMRQENPRLRFILTVSPVPLVATNSGDHVVVATMGSKSTLRSVAGQLARKRGYVDYFPSYELINSSPFGGVFFDPNKRSVNPHGVEFVMSQFFGALDVPALVPDARPAMPNADVVCEEELLDAFGAHQP